MMKLCRRRPEALIDGKRVALDWRSWQLLGFLHDRDGELVSNDELCNLFGLDVDLEACNGVVLKIVYHTRARLRRAGYDDLIETVKNQGYRLRGSV